MALKHKESLKMTFPCLPPDKLVGEYLKSRLAVKHVQLPVYESDKPRQDPELDRTAALRSYKKIETHLIQWRDMYKKERVGLDGQWKSLREEQDSLKENFARMSNFIKANEEKRQRAAERLQEDKKLYKERLKDIDKLERDIVKVQEAKQNFDIEIQKLLMYEKYMNAVCGITLDFKNGEEMIDRYESLNATKLDLGRRQNEAFLRLEKSKASTAKLIDDYTFQILGLNNIRANMNARYQIALSTALHWERIVSEIKSDALKKFKEIAEVKQACRNIYKLMCRRKGETAKIPEQDFEKQLDYIKKTLRDLRLVTVEAANMSKKVFSSTKVQTSKAS